MSKSIRLSQEEAARRVAAVGYTLDSAYLGRHFAVMVSCERHAARQTALAKNIFNGMRIACCAQEVRDAIAGDLREKMRGSANPFFGRKHSIESREKISAAVMAAPHALRGKPRPAYLTEALQRAVTGKPRGASTKAKLSAHMHRRHSLFEFCARKASEGRTAGKPGIFYIVRIGELAKFGSATTTMQYRLTRLRQKHGRVDLLMHCVVADAGAYEAAMMNAHRDRWVRGEYFNLET